MCVCVCVRACVRACEHLVHLLCFCCIFVSGMTGSTLNNSNVNLFISRDGGVSWNMVRRERR